MANINAGPAVSAFTNEVPLRGTFDQNGKLIQILGSGQNVAFDPANVAITGGVIAGLNSLSLAGSTKPILRNSRLALPNRLNVRQVMTVTPTITIGAASSMTAPFFRPSAAGTGFFVMANTSNDCFTYTKGAVSSGSRSAFVQTDNVTTDNSPTYSSEGVGISFIHDGPIFEISLGQTSTSFMVKIDDQYVSLTPTPTGSTGGAYIYAKYDFGGIYKKRRIDIIGQNIAFAGVNIGQTDSIGPAPVRGPRCIVVGDSFTQTYVGGYPQIFADALGWDNVWASGVGGTGYLATRSGAAPSFRQRVVHDVISYGPEVVMVVGSVNDGAFSASTVGAEAALLFSQITAALPNVLLVVAPTANGGVNKINYEYLTANKNAVKAACNTAGGFYLDLLELPLLTIPLFGNLLSGYSAGQLGTAGIFLNFVPQPGMTIEVGVSPTVERLQIKSFSQSGLTQWTALFDGALKYAHVANENVKQVGGSMWTGTGNTGSPTGFGNADRIVTNDNTHPSASGHEAIGQALADLLVLALAPN